MPFRPKALSLFPPSPSAPAFALCSRLRPRPALSSFLLLTLCSLRFRRRGLAYVEAMKQYKPTTPGFRFRRIVDRSHLWKGPPMKHLTVGLRKQGGRNHHGRLVVRERLLGAFRFGGKECAAHGRP